MKGAQRYNDVLMEKVEELAWMEQEGYIAPIRNGIVRLNDSGKLLCDAITSKLLIGDTART